MADVRLAVAIDGTAAERGASQVERAVDRMGRKVGGVGGIFGTATSAIGAFAKGLFSVQGLLGGLSIGAVFAGIGTTIKNFNAAMSDLSAITGATGKDLLFLRDAAKEFGKTTQLSATQAATAMKLIASAKPDLLENVGALKQVTAEVVNLSIAAGVELPAAATALGQAMNQFGADADQAGRFVNVLAAGAKFGASEIPATAAALVNAGTAAHSAGLSFEETNAAIQLLAKTGITAEQAGSKLSTILTRLAVQSNSQYNPAIVGMGKALQNMRDDGLGTAAATEQLNKLFGQFSINAGRALISLADEFDPLTEKLTGTQTAAEQVAAKTNDLASDLDLLSSAAEGTRIAIGEKLDPAFRSMTQAATSFFSSITDNLPAIIEFTAEVLKLGTALAAAVVAAKAATAISAFVAVVTSGYTILSAFVIGLLNLAAAMVAVRNAAVLMLAAINPVATAVGLLAAAATYAAVSYRDMTEEVKASQTAIDAVTGTVRGLGAAIQDINSMTPEALQLQRERTLAAIAEAQATLENVQAKQAEARTFGQLLGQSFMTGGGLFGDIDADTSALREQENQIRAQQKALQAQKAAITGRMDAIKASTTATQEESAAVAESTAQTDKQTASTKASTGARRGALESLEQTTTALTAQLVALEGGPIAAARFDAEHGRLAQTLKDAGDGAAHYKDKILELNRALESARAQEQFGDPGEQYRKRIALIDQLTLSEGARSEAIKSAQDALFRQTEARSRLTAEEQAGYALQTSMLALEKTRAANDPTMALKTQAEQYAVNNGLIQKNIALLESQIATLERLPASFSNSEAITRMQTQIESLRGSIRTVGDDIRDTFRDSLADSILEVSKGTKSIKDAFNSMADAIMNDMLSRFSKDISGAITQVLMPPTNGGGSGSLLGSLFGGLFGARGLGGPVAANRPYVVGEKRPEVFIPGTAGQIVPDANVGGVVLNMNINTPDANSFRASQDMISRDMAASVRHAQRFQG